jgi:multidrug resistance efflux pump
MSDTPRTDAATRLRGSLFFTETVVSESLERELNAAKADLAQRTAEVAKANAERDEAQLQLQRIRCEISCRVEHGADSNGHLEGILAMLKKEVQR